MRRHLHLPQLLGFLAFFGAVMVAGLVAKDWVTRATVGDIELAVQRGPNVDADTARHLTVAGRTLPDWSDLGWRLTGGRTDVFEDDREGISGLYERGGREVSVTIVEGAGGLEDTGDASSGLDCSEGCFGHASRPALYVKRDVAGTGNAEAATLVLVGTPVDERTRAALREVGAAL